MPLAHPDDIITPEKDRSILRMIKDYYHVSNFEDVPRYSINVSNIRFYSIDNNPQNDYLVVNFKGNQFYSWNKLNLNWWQKIVLGFGIKSFNFSRQDYNFLIVQFKPKTAETLYSIYCVGNVGAFVVFFFQLLDGSGTEGNSVGVKIPKGPV